MLRNKTKKDYLVPHVTVTEVDLEGLICNSVRFNIRVDSLENMNDPNNPLKGTGEAADEVFYFES